MPDDCDLVPITQSAAIPWPRAVAWLAVAAHLSVAIALWRAPQPLHPSDGNHKEISLCILLAQVNLLTLWLIVGYGPLIRRVAWTICGWSGICFVLATAESLQSAAAFVFALQVAMTGATVGVLRIIRRMAIRLPLEQPPDEGTRYRVQQFSILELFGAALGVAVAAALLIRIDLAATFQPPSFVADSIKALFAVSLPAALATLVSLAGLRGKASLSMQMVWAGLALLLAMALQIDPHGDWQGLVEIHAAHWFVVAATLWIFAMCGYQLIPTA